MMENIRIVLVNPSHPGNIGATARAMKTMGLSQLYIVDPVKYPDRQATAMASHASDVLEQAVVVDEIHQAIDDCQLVLATSARDRERPWPMLTPCSMAEKVAAENHQTSIAIMFGRESVGLSNEELQLAQYHIQIPTFDGYSSLNLAQAVQVICYELRLKFTNKQAEKVIEVNYASSKEVEGLYQHLEASLVDSGFINPEKPMQTMTKLRRIFSRARLEGQEVSLLRGVVKSLSGRK